MRKKAIFCSPFYSPPAKGKLHPFMRSLEAAVPAIVAAGWDEGLAQQVFNPYISFARATMLRKALDAKADVIVFHDYDLTARPEDYVRLLETEGDVVAGTYRYKKDEEQYMGDMVCDPSSHVVIGRKSDGAIKTTRVPAGFLKITKEAVNLFMAAYPELVYGASDNAELAYAGRNLADVLYGSDPNGSVDLFNHGAHMGVWYGEDMAFSRRWSDLGGDIWLVPDLDLTHWDGDKPYPGNLHQFLMRQPGGINDPLRIAAE